MVCYWITIPLAGQGRQGTGDALVRITHAWLKTGNDWRIIGGMSMLDQQPER